MKPLYKDQIHSPGFQMLCDYMWADDFSREEKSGIWDYAVGCTKDYDMKLIDHTNVPMSGVIFVGMCHIIEDIYKKLPRDGNYIIVHRTNDRQYLPEFDAVKPPSVKHVYTVDCKGTFKNVTAIPFGNASINGDDELVKNVATNHLLEYIPAN